MAIEDTWEAIWNRFVEIIQGMPEFTDKSEQVYHGEKFPPNKFPSAYVVPTLISGGPGTPVKEDWILTYEIGIVVKNADMKAGVLAAMKLILQLKTLLIADRNLTVDSTQLVLNLEVPSITPNWRDMSSYENHWVGLVVACSVTT